MFRCSCNNSITFVILEYKLPVIYCNTQQIGVSKHQFE
ncbi:hypothetical protein P879_05989 [Paragonimus westermani]|uniref:Uncharacterized protein n=1 Tax=Paragonimus westermani TaxID=34504 RepID=A0A8T0DK81_9TREM|nr:hypothetical protein P879_05989 [Paragonimus westermani]